MIRILLPLMMATNFAFAEEPLLRPNDRVALLGGSFFERMQSSGALESEAQCRKPDWKLRFRNIGWSGDDVHGIARKRFDEPEDGFKRLLQDIETADPTVVLIGYGFAEASDGSEAVGRFEPGLTRLADEISNAHRRVVLVTPVSMPGYRVDGYEASMDRCRDIVEKVGNELDLPVISVDWRPSDTALNVQRLFPNEYGYRQYARQLAGALVGGTPCERPSEQLAKLIAEKNQLFFHRYRPQNETYLFLFRKHEQGNNAVEIPMFDPLIRQADEAIWKEASRKR